ncbi:MAG: GntR family transcriptional regulator [Deltaproteobacteria bacterium]|nr:GntR family transcriptional regulator [Deltaproteobacteria bacterium]
MDKNFLDKMAEIPPLTTDLLVNKIYTILEENIIGMTLSPETKLVEDNIARALGVSRSPVREALMQLENAGLVIRKGNKGRVVVSFTEQEVIDSYVVREMIESYAGGLACLAAREEDLRKIEDVLNQMKTFSGGKSDLLAYLKLNYDFHSMMIAPCPNKPLIRMFENALKPIKWCWNLNVAWQYGPASSAYDRHKQLFDIYRAGDRVAYEKLIRMHIQDASVRFRKVYAKRKSRKEEL